MPDDRRYSDEELALLMRRAVEMEAGRDSTSTSPVVARSAEGFTLEEARDIAAEAGIRRAASHHGVVMTEPGALVWRSVGQPTQLDVTLEPGAGSTRVTVTADRSGAAGLAAFGSIGAWLVAAGITGAVLDPSVAGGVALIVSALAGGAVTARTIWSGATRRLHDRIVRMGEEVEAALTSTSVPRVRSESPDPTA